MVDDLSDSEDSMASGDSETGETVNDYLESLIEPEDHHITRDRIDAYVQKLYDPALMSDSLMLFPKLTPNTPDGVVHAAYRTRVDFETLEDYREMFADIVDTLSGPDGHDFRELMDWKHKTGAMLLQGNDTDVMLAFAWIWEKEYGTELASIQERHWEIEELVEMTLWYFERVGRPKGEKDEDVWIRKIKKVLEKETEEYFAEE